MDLDLEVEEMSLELGAKKQDPHDNKTNFEANTAVGREPSSRS